VRSSADDVTRFLSAHKLDEIVGRHSGFFDVRNVSIPVAVSAFPDEIYQSPRSWVERAFPKFIHYNKLDKGSHFAAWEQPALFTAEMRAAFKSLRQSI